MLQATGKTIDPWCFNVPTGTDIGVMIPTDSDMLPTKDLVVYRNASQHPNGKVMMKIDGRHLMYDPLLYVLIFQDGDKGWELGSFHISNKQNYKCTALQYYKYCFIP